MLQKFVLLLLSFIYMFPVSAMAADSPPFSVPQQSGESVFTIDGCEITLKDIEWAHVTVLTSNGGEIWDQAAQILGTAYNDGKSSSTLWGYKVGFTYSLPKGRYAHYNGLMDPTPGWGKDARLYIGNGSYHTYYHEVGHLVQDIARTEIFRRRCGMSRGPADAASQKLLNVLEADETYRELDEVAPCWYTCANKKSNQYFPFCQWGPTTYKRGLPTLKEAWEALPFIQDKYK